MTLSSISFLWFLAAFLTLYGLCPAQYRRYLLLVGSLVVIAFNSPTELPFSSSPVLSWIFGLLCAVSFAFVNFVLGICIQRTTCRRAAMAAAVAFNVIVLVTFKLSGITPIGLSFYTFSFIAYLVDIGRGQCQAETDPVRFSNFSFFYPKFLMGPITRYGELGVGMDQPKPSLSGLQEGLERFVLGFAMAVLVKDRLAILWHDLNVIGFSSLSTPLAWLGAFSFSIQLFLEWQSYMLMASGIAGILGYPLPQNFNYPYLARSIGEFYRRWHITLMRWFKDYVYIPLGGNRKGSARTILNILIVWLLTSLWHGQSLNFLLWGMSLGLFIVIEKLWLAPVLERHRLLSHLWVLFLIPLTWVCFNIDDSAELAAYFSRLFPFFGGEDIVGANILWINLKKFGLYLILGVLCCFPLPELLVRRFGRTWIGSILLAVLFWYAVYELNHSSGNNFMYLNF